jgi:iron transport multicopper oxidase
LNGSFPSAVGESVLKRRRHTIAGLIAIFVEAPADLQSALKVPQDQLDACKDLDIATSGNAAGNTKDPLDLSGANVPPGPIPNGFTSRGIVAMAFSSVAAILGMTVIVWYGMVPLKN